MIVRKATPDDIERVSILWEQMVKEMRPDFTPNRQWWMQMCQSFMSNGFIEYELIVAEDNDKIIGFIDGMMFPEPSTGKVHGTGQHFYILPEYRKTMVAAKLYRQIISIAIKKGIDAVEFFCFPESIKFWKKRGYNLTRCMMRRTVNV